MTLGAPGWALAAIAVLLLAIFYLWEFAHRQRMALMPKFDISFEQDRLGIVQGMIEWRQAGQIVKQHEQSFVRVRVDASGRSLKCAAYITRLEKSTDNGNTFKEVEIPQALPLLGHPFDVFPKIPSIIDFVVSNAAAEDGKDRLYPANYWPFKLRDALNDRGVYRFEIAITDIVEGVSKTIIVDVFWNGKWDTVTAKQFGAVK